MEWRKGASAYKYSGIAVVVPASTTKDGIVRDEPPAMEVDLSDVNDCGTTLLKAIEVSRQGFVDPNPLAFRFEYVLAALAVSSYKKFAKSGSQVAVTIVNGKAVFEPMKRANSGNYFESIPNSRIESELDPRSMGTALAAAFASCESNDAKAVAYPTKASRKH